MPEASTVETVIDEMAATVDYVREHGVEDVVEGVTGWVKANPTYALVGALALGFLAAVLLRRH